MTRVYEIRVCPICGGDAVQFAHGRCLNECRDDAGVIPPMVPVRVVSLGAVVEALRERGEFACGGFEKEAAAFLEAEFGVPQPEQPA